MTITEIAKLAGVSISTVSKIINNKDEAINQKTKEKVLKIVKEYNYIPYSKSINSLSSKKTFLIAILLRGDSINKDFIDGIIDTAQKNSYSTLIYTSNRDHQSELKNISALIKNNVDALIWEPVSKKSLEHKELLKNNNIIINYINSNFVSNTYNIDFKTIGYKASELLVQKKHKDILCIFNDNKTHNQTKLNYIFTGIKKCFFDNNILYDHCIEIELENELWQNKILSHQVSAVFCLDFNSLSKVLNYIKNINFHIPNDLSIICLFEYTKSYNLFSHISGISIPYYDFATFICQNIINKCENNTFLNKNFEYEYFYNHKNTISKPYLNKYKNIIVLGSINIDITLMVDKLPLPGMTVITDKHMISVGGKGSNEAVAVAKLGYPVSIIGNVGDDADANLIYNCMLEHNINTQYINRDSKYTTGKAFIHILQNGDSLISVLSGANYHLNIDYIKNNLSVFKNASFCLIQTEVPDETIFFVAKTANDFGIKNVVKPASITKLNKNLMPYIDIFVPNLSEAQTLCPTSNKTEEMALYFKNLGAKTVIITLAEKGAYVLSDEFTGYIDSIKTNILDATGGADSFIAALVIYLNEGYSLKKAVRIAHYAASFCISRAGTTTSMIDRLSLERHILSSEKDLLNI